MSRITEFKRSYMYSTRLPTEIPKLSFEEALRITNELSEKMTFHSDAILRAALAEKPRVGMLVHSQRLPAVGMVLKVRASDSTVMTLDDLIFRVWHHEWWAVDVDSLSEEEKTAWALKVMKK